MRIALAGTPAAPLREALLALAGDEPAVFDPQARDLRDAFDLVVVPVGGLPDAALPERVVVYGGDAADAALDLEAGAALWVDDSESSTALRARLAALARTGAGSGAPIDRRTGLVAARRFLGLLDDEFRRAARYRRPLGLLVLALPGAAPDAPVDASGDELSSAAAVVSRTCREVDRPGRLGGPRLAVLMPESDAAAARALASRLAGALPKTIDARFGIAAFPARDIAAPRHLAGRALEALARAVADRPGAVVAFGDPAIVWARTPPEPDFS